MKFIENLFGKKKPKVSFDFSDIIEGQPRFSDHDDNVARVALAKKLQQLREEYNAPVIFNEMTVKELDLDNVEDLAETLRIEGKDDVVAFTNEASAYANSEAFAESSFTGSGKWKKV